MTEAAWQRQPGETAQQYAGFLVYLNIPAPKRSITAAWNERLAPGQLLLPGKKRNCSRVWARWAREFEWRNRAIEWDMDLGRQRAERSRQNALDQLQLPMASSD